MKFVTIVAMLCSFSAFANCRINLETSGLSASQKSEVSQILKTKNYTVAKKLIGNETDFSVKIFKVENCIPGLSEIYETGGGFEISSAAQNIEVRKEGRFSRIMFSRNQFGLLKAALSKLPSCH